MIYESSYWKDDLLKTASKLRRRLRQRRWTEASLSRFEQEVMVGFYSVRKLQEAWKISDRFRDRPVPLVQFPSTGIAVRRLNRTELDELYDFANPNPMTRQLAFVANQIIHSYVFTPGFDEQGLLTDVFFSSNDRKDQAVYMVAVSEIAVIFEEVGSNYPSRSQQVWDPVKGREIVRVD